MIDRHSPTGAAVDESTSMALIPGAVRCHRTTDLPRVSGAPYPRIHRLENLGLGTGNCGLGALSPEAALLTHSESPIRLTARVVPRALPQASAQH